MTYQEQVQAARAMATPLPTETIILRDTEIEAFKVYAGGVRTTDLYSAVGYRWTTMLDGSDTATITPEGLVTMKSTVETKQYRITDDGLVAA